MHRIFVEDQRGGDQVWIVEYAIIQPEQMFAEFVKVKLDRSIMSKENTVGMRKPN